MVGRARANLGHLWDLERSSIAGRRGERPPAFIVGENATADVLESTSWSQFSMPSASSGRPAMTLPKVGLARRNGPRSPAAQSPRRRPPVDHAPWVGRFRRILTGANTQLPVAIDETPADVIDHVRTEFAEPDESVAILVIGKPRHVDLHLTTRRSGASERPNEARDVARQRQRLVSECPRVGM